jgi:hypothetical protein
VIARAWTAQLRLTGRFRRLEARKTSRNIVVTAIARELAGFVWAEMTAPGHRRSRTDPRLIYARYHGRA